MVGKALRLRRLFDRQSRRAFVVNLSGGLASGPLAGLSHLEENLPRLASAGVTAIVLNPGQARRHAGAVAATELALVVRLSGASDTSSHPDAQMPIGTIQEAIEAGADAALYRINMGSAEEGRMLCDFARTANEAARAGMPLVAEVFPPARRDGGASLEGVAHAIRLAVDLGADLIRTAFTGSSNSMRAATRGGAVPILVGGGGALRPSDELLGMVSQAVAGGANGIMLGRNLFQRDDPVDMAGDLAELIHGRTFVAP